MSAAALPLTTMIRLYQRFISPYLGSNCRFVPSCSAYAIGVLERHGVVKGLYLATRRILACHPWNAGGTDPVPESFSLRRPRKHGAHA